MIMCNKDQIEDSETKIIKPQNEEVPNLVTQEKTPLTLTDSKESTAMCDGINHDLNNTNQGPISDDGTEIDLSSVAPLDDPNEFPYLDAQNQSRVHDRPPRKLKRATSISPGHRANNKKRNSRTSSLQSNEV